MLLNSNNSNEPVKPVIWNVNFLRSLQHKKYMQEILTILFQGIAAFAALAAVIITILLNWNRLRKNQIFKPTPLLDQKTSTFTIMSRRKFLILGAVATGAIFWTSIYYKFGKKKLKTIYHRFFHTEKNLVINKKTGIIHHKKLCSDHLPIDENVADSKYNSSKIRFHKSKKIPILDLTAQEKSAEDAIEILLLAAEGNPTSVHIYDKLITLFGKIKRYESIHLLLKSVEDELSEILSGKKRGTKEHKKYQKALRHIQGQKEKTLKNARNRAIAKYGPICLGETT
jgi:hypothetical protein